MATKKCHEFVAIGVPNVVFVPVIFEVTGRLGPSGLHFFNTYIASVHRDRGLLFLKQANAIIMRWNAKMVMEARSNFCASNVARRQMDVRGRAAGVG